jgi:hypothetical protein
VSTEVVKTRETRRGGRKTLQKKGRQGWVKDYCVPKGKAKRERAAFRVYPLSYKFTSILNTTFPCCLVNLSLI